MKKLLILTLIILCFGAVCAAQETVREEVSVDWWILPIFAVDADENPVPHLAREDIDVFMDGEKVEDFTLYLRRFFSQGLKEQKIKVTAPVKAELERDRLIFFLFDTVLSGKHAIARAKALAGDIVKNASPDTRFAVFAIEPYAGLTYLGGPEKCKLNVYGMIAGVKERSNPQYTSLLGRTGVLWNHLGVRDRQFFRGSRAGVMRRQSRSFFSSISDFYFNLYPIKGNKFTYLFSEGVPRHREDMDDFGSKNYLKQAAGYLARCGSVLFVINTQGTSRVSENISSGRDSLEFLASRSGGKYLEGTSKKIRERINNFHHAYFEVAFAHKSGCGDGIHQVRVQPKRRGLRLHTMASVERKKPYETMEEIEKKVLVLSLISQNPLYNNRFRTGNIDVLEMTRGRRRLEYLVRLPGEYLDKNIDFFKVIPNSKTGSPRIEKEVLVPRENLITLSLPLQEGGGETNFALVDPVSRTALIHGPGLYTAEQKRKAPRHKKL